MAVFPCYEDITPLVMLIHFGTDYNFWSYHYSFSQTKTTPPSRRMLPITSLHHKSSSWSLFSKKRRPQDQYVITEKILKLKIIIKIHRMYRIHSKDPCNQWQSLIDKEEINFIKFGLMWLINPHEAIITQFGSGFKIIGIEEIWDDYYPCPIEFMWQCLIFDRSSYNYYEVIYLPTPIHLISTNTMGLHHGKTSNAVRELCSLEQELVLF